MQNTPLYSNLFAPSEERIFLERRRISALLEQAVQSPLVTVVAGEGYGKTQGVYSFLGAYNPAAVWLQLSERDNLGWRFWENYTNAVSLYSQTAGTALREMGFPETTRQFDRYISFLKNEMIGSKKYIVVLDDFHLIHEKPLLRFLDRILSTPIPNTSIILISRKEPAINTVSFLSKGMLAGLGTEDLRFTREEIGDYFKFRGLPLSEGEVEQLYYDTEGWALAVDLVVQEIKARGGEGGGVHSLKNMDAFRKIEEKFFNAVSPALRKFLIKISLIEHWPRELLESLNPPEGYIRNLEKLSSLIRYDTFLHGYRIHHLFIEFLQEKQGELSPEEVRAMYLNAAQWCLKNNLRMDAAINYERARCYRGVLDIIYSFPRLLSEAVAAFFLELVDSLVAKGENETDDDLLFLRHNRSRLFISLGRFDEAAALCRESIAQFEALPPGPLRSRILSANYRTLGSLKILTFRSKRDYDVAPLFEKADQYYREYPSFMQGPGNVCCIGSYVIQVGYPAEKGEMEYSIRKFIPAIPFAAHCFNGYLYGVDALSWAELYYFQGDVDNAEQFARQALFKAREKGQFETETRALFYLLRTKLHAGDFPALGGLLKQLEVQLETVDYPNRFILYDIVTGWFYAHLEQNARIAPWLRNDFEESDLNSTLYGFETLVKAKCSFADGRYDAALHALEQRKGDHHGLRSLILGKVEADTLEAAAYLRLGETGAAVKALESAWEAAASNNLDMPFIELGEDMRILAGICLNREACSIPRSWLEAVRSRASVYGKKLALLVEQYQAGVKQAVLSRQEQTVLRCLSQGLTREEIADEAGISLNTVKALIKGLYNKLGALNRADAVRIAAVSGLLKQPEH
ncbi:MAG: LuxR C-terminal-related transcriptional regulator [Treponema sp.]|jgi:LuxR family maltose regulon positive regulatory protein|nr:LuxR C-terminal-related transcriptional regulator [Treponema sp.]